MVFCSEGHLGVDAEDLGTGLTRHIAVSIKEDIVVSRWGERWNIPSDGGLELISNRGGLVVVLIIEWGTVPVNVDVDVLESS